MTDLLLRLATEGDIPALNALIALSAEGLSQNYYTPEETKSAMQFVFGVDSELVKDGTYFVVEAHDVPVACGGWSKRRTLFGGDAYAGRANGLLNPDSEPAKIRAFFVHPDWARQGIGRLLLNFCEAEAMRHCFTKAELMSTLPGLPFYQMEGYVAGEEERHAMPDGSHVRFVPMHKVFA